MSENTKKRWIITKPSLLQKGEKGDTGPQGPAGEGIELPLSSDDVEYAGQTLTEILDELLYTPLIISSFSASVSTYEKGVVLTSVTLTWSFNKSIQIQSITGAGVVSPTLLVGDRNKVVTLSSVSVNTTITLTADDDTTDDKPAKTATVGLSFLNKVYWGKGSIPGTPNSAFILGLSNNELRSNRTKSFTISAGANEYIFFALPVAYGIPSFKTNGFNGGYELLATISFTNASGHTENYNIYRSSNHSLGTTFTEVL